MAPAVALATCAEHPGLDAEGRLLLDALCELGIRARPEVWTRTPRGGWDGYDLVVLRSTWDYTFALERFLRWGRALGPRLLNAPDVVAWNADKGYLNDLERAGVRAVPTERLAPGAAFEPPPGRFVVKPAVAAGARGAAVYDEVRRDEARRHVAALHADGLAVLLQPYLDAVDGPEAETALVHIDGALSHTMRKGPLLALGQAPEDGLFAAEDMRRVSPEPDVLELAGRAHRWVAERFGTPLYARVDILRDGHGAPAVLELELIEPSLFLDHEPGSAQALARAIIGRLP